MEKGKQPIVIAISGVSGGGKTTMVKYLNDILPNYITLFFDDYDFVGPDDIIEWVDKGANYDEWNLDPLILDLKELISQSFDYIVLDFPFAYKHFKTSKMIDITVFIDTPLDIAMARRVIRDFKNSSKETVLIEMENYILQGRRGYSEMLKSIKPNSDIIIDGTLSVPEIADEIYKDISIR